MQDRLLLTPEELESNLHQLANESALTNARKAGDKMIAGLTQSDINAYRHRAKTDLFWLCYGILGYDRLSPKLHGSLCKWLSDTATTHRFREILLARGHFKSTVATIGDSIRIALPSSDPDNSPYPENLGPDCRILIAHEVADMASQFLFEITQHFLSTPWLLGLFPECIPVLRKQRISTKFLELPRSSAWKEATFSTMGVGGKSQGGHWNYLKLDDLIGREARMSTTVMNSAKNWFDNIQAFFSYFSKDKFDLVGTRWAFDDLYSHAEERYGEKLTRYVRGAEIIVNGKLVPLFDEEYSSEDFDIIKKDPQIWASQYANDPSLGSTEWEQSWLRWFVWNDRRVKYKDILTGQFVFWDVSDLDINILLDPAMTGKAGLLVTGMDEIGNVYILEALKSNWKPPELADLIFKLVDKWNPRLVAIEKVLFSGLFEHWFKDRMRLTGKHFRVEPISTRGEAKEARVRGLSNYFKGGQIFFHPDQKDLITEFKQFGATDDYHMLDALAQGPEVWRKGIPTRKIREALTETSPTIGQDPVGGY